jgi:hypothetical protein
VRQTVVFPRPAGLGQMQRKQPGTGHTRDEHVTPSCWRRAQCLGMMSFTGLASVSSDRLVPFTDRLRLAAAAYLARFKGSSRDHTESDRGPRV